MRIQTFFMREFLSLIKVCHLATFTISFFENIKKEGYFM